MASSLELNKLLAGVLTAGIVAVGAAVFSGLLYPSPRIEEHAFPVDTGEAETEMAEAEPAAEEPSIAVLLADADPAAGETITRQCAACHVFNEGGENRVGPYLWDVVGRDIASVGNFNYSQALQDKEGEWTFEKLDAFLENPRDWAPGTSMSYAGLRGAEDRANLIAYLRAQSNDPVPLPEPEAEAAAEESAPAEETETAAAEEAETAAAEEAAPAEETETAAAEEAAPAEEAETAAAEEPAPAEEAETAVAEETETAAAETAEATNGAALSGMVAMVADADPAVGERNFRQCAACHTVDQGGQNRVGPNLWGVFGADVGHHEGFSYSDALLSIEGIWTVEKLDAYLENPRAFAPGNRMAFAGLRNEDDRAAVIAYLRNLSEDPKPVDVGD